MSMQISARTQAKCIITALCLTASTFSFAENVPVAASSLTSCEGIATKANSDMDTGNCIHTGQCFLSSGTYCNSGDWGQGIVLYHQYAVWSCGGTTYRTIDYSGNDTCAKE